MLVLEDQSDALYTEKVETFDRAISIGLPPH